MNLFNLLRNKPRNKIVKDPRKAFILGFIRQFTVGLIALAFGFASFYTAMNFFEIVTIVSTFIDSVSYKLGLKMILMAGYIRLLI